MCFNGWNKTRERRSRPVWARRKEASGALSHESLLDLFRRGEVLADARTNEEELASLRRYAMPAGAAIVGGGGFGSGGAVGKG